MILSTASLASTLVEMLPTLTRWSGISFRSGPAWVPMALLLAGGIGCLTRWRPTPAILMVYAYAAMAVQVVYYFLIIGPRVWSQPGVWSVGGLVAWMSVALLQTLGLPLLVLGIVRQPPVKRLFERK